MVEAFIRERGVTVCPPHRVQHAGPSAAGGETPDCFLFRKSSSPRTPEQKLAVAKILQMLQDLAGIGRIESSHRFRVQHDAKRWFFSPPGTTDFELWCDSAGIDPEVIRQKARDIELNGWPQWRAEAGRGKRYTERRAYRERLKQRGIQ